MSRRDQRSPKQADARELFAYQDYEPPRVERVLTSVDLEREALYAGRPSLQV